MVNNRARMSNTSLRMGTRIKGTHSHFCHAIRLGESTTFVGQIGGHACNPVTYISLVQKISYLRQYFLQGGISMAFTKPRTRFLTIVATVVLLFSGLAFSFFAFSA